MPRSRIGANTLAVTSRPVQFVWDRFLGATSGAARVWMLAATLGALAAILAVLVLPALPVSLPTNPALMLILLLVFYVTEAKVIHLHIGQSAHSFSLTEFPLVAGLIMATPLELIAARVAGSALALVINRRQTPVKLAFNLAQFGLCTVSSVAIVHLGIAPGRDFGLSLWGAVWLAVFAAVLVENLVGVITVSAAISLADATPQYRRIPEMLKIGLAVSMTTTSLALMCITVLFANPESILLFIVPIVMIFVSYRAYISERQQHQNIEMLYESTRILQRGPQLDTGLISLLAHVRTMFRADVAEICLLPTREGDDVLRSRVGPGDAMEVMQPIGPSLDDPVLLRAVAERRAYLLDGSAPVDSAGAPQRRGQLALVGPLLGESNLIGTIRVAHRMSDISTFDLADLKLFETLAGHTAIALENGQLEQSLEQLSRLKDELHQQASHDALTGLANRAVFLQAVAQRLESIDENGRIPVVLFIDLDDFKMVNDSLGHDAGDALLVAVGDRLCSAIRASDLAARLGGDEFAILLWDEPDLGLTMRVANRLTTAMLVDFHMGGHDVSVRASIGVASGRPGIDVAGDLVRNADVAMYSAKASGKSRVVVFEPSMHEAVMARAVLSADLEHAIAAREFVLQYQPIVHVATGRIAGVEALVRWHHPERGWVGPDEFISVAEETGAIVGIGRWVLGEACRQMQILRAVASPHFTMSVNVSSRELGQPAFVEQALNIIREAAVDPAEIVLEITETAMLRDWEATRAKLQELREAGVGISIDDFGTGYSSLSYLQQLPVTTLKIARDFVRDDSDPKNWELASAIIALGRALKLDVIAEGVERRSQLQCLRALGCEYVQGYFYAPPLAPAALEAQLSGGGLMHEPEEINRASATVHLPAA